MHGLFHVMRAAMSTSTFSGRLSAPAVPTEQHNCPTLPPTLSPNQYGALILRTSQLILVVHRAREQNKRRGQGGRMYLIVNTDCECSEGSSFVHSLA